MIDDEETWVNEFMLAFERLSSSVELVVFVEWGLDLFTDGWRANGALIIRGGCGFEGALEMIENYFWTSI